MRFTANMKGGTQERIAALQIFRDDPQISILLLDGVGAVGLDLSFVSHIFLLDPIWDKSLEDQVISRAHRLGAKRSITVEKLIARQCEWGCERGKCQRRRRRRRRRTE
jgi:SNF2 family DNA or RNA helicase